MKQLFILATLALAASGAAQAQRVRFGLKGGSSYTTVVGQHVAGVASKWGFHGGVLVNVKLSDQLSLQPEVLYSQKGTKGADDSNRINLNYVDLPVLLRVGTGLGGLFIEVGPQLGYLAGSDASVGSRTPLARVTADFAGSYPPLRPGLRHGLRLSIGQWARPRPALQWGLYARAQRSHGRRYGPQQCVSAVSVGPSG